MRFSRFVYCSAFLFFACACFAQMYTVMDLGTLGGAESRASGINASGQVVGESNLNGNLPYHAFRTAPNTPINAATDDLGAFDYTSSASGINDSGQVVGTSETSATSNYQWHAFRTAPNMRIDPVSDDLGGTCSMGNAINTAGQVVGWYCSDPTTHAFRTAPNKPINPATDDLGTLGGYDVMASGINESGQVVGGSQISPYGPSHAFRTAPNKPINPATDDLGTLGGKNSVAMGINNLGEVVGESRLVDVPFAPFHAFRTAPNMPINPATDDLGTLGGTRSSAWAINDSGQVVGWAYVAGDAAEHAFIYSRNIMYDLNELISADSAWDLQGATAINDAGQIVGNGTVAGSGHAFLLTPIYNAAVQQPINADGSSVFTAKRGVIPVKFAVTQYGTQPSCALPATIAVTRTAGGTLGSIDENTYSMSADNGSNFRIDSCQYVYNLAASALGVGSYRVDLSINGIMVGHAVFALK